MIVKLFLQTCSVLFLFASCLDLHGSSPQEGYTKINGPKWSDIESFDGVPLGEKVGIVQDIITLDIPDVKDPYNASMVKTDHGYTVAFRYDLPWNRIGFKKAKIGLIEVDNFFRPLGEAQFLTLDDQVEDPRIFSHNNDTYISYTHLTFWGPRYLCNIGLSKVDLSSQKAEESWDLLFKKGPMEKNWVPFSYTNGKGQSELYFVYSYSPHEIVRVQDPISGIIEHPISPDATPKKGIAAWTKKWGHLSGGTPAILVDGEYVSFFHSRFRDSSYFWYVMGAITFDSKPPFALKKISQFPIMFKQIYTTPLAKARNQALRAIFPGGIALDTQNGKDVFQVICGENDTGIKIVTIDKEALYKNMRPA